MAIGWRQLELMRKEGIGVKEVESQAWTRSMNREVKKGKNVKGIKKGEYTAWFKRDERFIKKTM